MRKHVSPFFALLASAVLIAGCDGNKLLDPRVQPDGPLLAAQAQTQFATLTKLPSLGSNSEALAVDAGGTVIVGHSFDRAGMLYAVKWTLQNGLWKITKLSYTGSARATGINSQGDAVGYGATPPRRAVRWSPANVSTALDCGSDAGESTASAISAGGGIAVGAGAGRAAIWRTGSCRESLPQLTDAGYSSAATTNGDGTVVGGSGGATSGDLAVPIRWREVLGQWVIEQLDSRRGRASGANGAGDLAGHVVDPCALTDGCARPMLWYAVGGSRTIDAGGEQSYAHDINAAGEVVGVKTSNGRSTAYIWSEALGVRDLAVKGSDGVARAVSDVRADGSRVVAGLAGTGAAVWVVRTP